jgi:AraC-like DNA-binding protein/mannose-6-phosphate isomerase-like protein (cupin superfamily)
MVDERIQNAKINKAEVTFTKSIPYKVYLLDYGSITGTSYHTHDYVQIWYVLEGSCGHFVDGTTYRLTKGSLFILPPFVSHQILPFGETGLKIFGCEFSPSFADEAMRSIVSGPGKFNAEYMKPIFNITNVLQPNLCLTGQATVETEALFTNMLNEFTFERKYFDINIKSDLIKLLILIARENADGEENLRIRIYDSFKENMNKAIDYINNHYSAKIYIEDICKIAAMSKTYFSHYFKQSTGKTFTEYINHLRIRKAMVLLAETKDTITEICQSCGYNDITYFNRVFKKETGSSPGQYRRKLQKT